MIIVAGGVLAYGVHDLQEAGFLPGLNNLAFDVSDTIPPASWYGTLLKGIFNFSPATTKLEAIVWLLYVVPTMTLFLRSIRRAQPPRPPPAVPATTAALTRLHHARSMTMNPLRLAAPRWPCCWRCPCWRPAPTTPTRRSRRRRARSRSTVHRRRLRALRRRGARRAT